MNKQEKNTLLFAGFLIFSGILLGALGAHALKEILSLRAIESFKTGVFYQISQAIGILLIVLIQKNFNVNLSLSSKLLLIGTILFSGSIYILSFSEKIDLGVFKSILGPITPLGGILMITAWLIFIIKVAKSTQNP